MSFLSAEALAAMGFKRLGKNVRISDRAAIYNPEEMEIGDCTRIDDFCVVSGKISLGRNVHVAVFCNLGGGTEGIVMEDFSGLAYHAQVFTQSDDYSGRTLTNPTVPEKYKAVIRKPVRLGRHSIVGAGSIILPGVTLAEGTSVGAMSLVSKSTLEWSVYFGAPAKRIKSRDRALLELERQYLAEG